jgi:hypothetical protein
MQEKKSYAEEVFEKRCERYRKQRRTKHPWQEALDTCQRVNALPGPTSVPLRYPDDFALDSEPSDGRVPLNLFDVAFEVNPMSGAAVLQGRGGVIELDDRVCKIDLTRRLLQLCLPDSCGECTFCRIGTTRMDEILQRLSVGEGTMDDLEALKDLAGKIQETSLCELGKNAAAPVLSGLRHYRREYEAHIVDRACPAGTCPIGPGNSK